MQRFVPRALLGAAVALTAAACAAGTADPAAGPGESQAGGRYRILVPALEVQGAQPQVGENVANSLRGLISGMATHTSVSAGELRNAMRQHNLAELDAITARQLAQLMNAQLVSWGTVQPGGDGLQAEVTFVDVASGDQISVEGVSGANPRALAQAIFAGFEERVEGIRQASFCNDYLASQQFERALETCERALAIVPNSTAALYGHATALFHLERYEEALTDYQRLLEIDSTHQDGLLGAGLAASQLERGSEALGYYRQYMELNPGDPAVRMKVAGDIAQAGDVVSAYHVLQPAAAEQQDNIEYQQYLAQVATAAGQAVSQNQGAAEARPYFQTALDAFDRVFAAGGEEVDVAVIRQRLAVMAEMGQTAEAIRLAEQWTQRFPRDEGLLSQYAIVLSRANRHADAVRVLNQLREVNPRFENIDIRIALAYMEAGNRQAALSALQRAAQGGDRQTVAQAIFQMAAGPLRAERWAEAEGLLSMAQEYASGNLRSEIAFFRGLSLYRQGEAIARGNTQGRAPEARRALEFFERALPHLRASNHAQSAQVASAAQQYIENQRAIIEAARGR